MGNNHLRLPAAALALWAAACGEKPTGPPAPAPAGPPPSFTALRVEKNRIVDADGAGVVLRGVAVVDPLVGRGYRYSTRLGEHDLETLAREWRAGIVRVPMHPDLMAHHPAYLREFVDPLVDWAGEHRLYLTLPEQTDGVEWAFVVVPPEQLELLATEAGGEELREAVARGKPACSRLGLEQLSGGSG